MSKRFPLQILAALVLTALILVFVVEPDNAQTTPQERMFNPSCVSEITITAPAESIANLYADPKGEYQPATMVFDVCGVGEEVYGPLSVTFRLKGSGSFATLDGKAAFKVKMPSGQRIDGLKSLTLNNMVQDLSSMHEVLAYDSYRAVGVPAPRVGYANVSVNGASYGVHSNVETPDNRFLDAAFGVGAWQHLYESPEIDAGNVTYESRDILPDAVSHFQIDEGDKLSVTDLTALAQISTISDDAAWWTAFQTSFDTDEVMKFWAAATFIGDPDSYVADVNNYYLKSATGGRFSFMPWGTDRSFTDHLELDPPVSNSTVFRRCMNHEPCYNAYRTQLDPVAEKIISLDLVGKAHSLYESLKPAVAADPRKDMTMQDFCWAVDKTLKFLIIRADVWATDYRDPESGVTSAQSSERLDCSAVDPVTPETTAPVIEPAQPGDKTPAVGGVSVNGGARYTKSRNVRLTVAWPEGASRVALSNDARFAASRSFSKASRISWTLAQGPRSSGKRTVHARFTGSGISAVVATDTIVLDSDPPAVSRVKVRRLRSVDSSNAGRSYRLTVSAHDSRSGVNQIEIETSKNRKPLKQAFDRTHRVELSTKAKRVWLRAVDRAGNVGRWTTVQLARSRNA